jgi:hypothetical protein
MAGWPRIKKYQHYTRERKVSCRGPPLVPCFTAGKGVRPVTTVTRDGVI